MSRICVLAIDEHNVHPMTEELLDTWWESMSSTQKAAIYAGFLGDCVLTGFATDLREELAAIQVNITGQPFHTGGLVPTAGVDYGLVGLNCCAISTKGLPL